MKDYKFITAMSNTLGVSERELKKAYTAFVSDFNNQ